MVKLEIKDYCQTCPYFEPDVITPSTMFYADGTALKKNEDTIIKCSNREICEYVRQSTISENDKKQKDFEHICKLVYGPPLVNPDWEDICKKVEDALGFKLFTWQKTYIFYGEFRRYGNTTATILRLLLTDMDKPLTEKDIGCLNSVRGKFFENELKRIKTKLDAAGIVTRKIDF